MSRPKSKGPDGDRLANGRFRPGWKGGPGNPHLKHAGELQRAIREAVTGPELTLVMRRLLHMAVKESDTAAARLLIERCIGKPSDEPRPFGIDLGDIDTAAGVAAAMHVVASAAANGDITAPDAMAIVAVLRGVSDATTFAELEQRVGQLEGRTA